MTRSRALSGFVVVLGVALGLCGSQSSAATPAPSLKISGSDITMPSNGTGDIPFVLTSVNGFAGTVTVTCAAPAPAAGVREPGCYTGGPVRGYSLSANGTAAGMVAITAMEPLAMPVVGRLDMRGDKNDRNWVLAGALMLGFGLRRRRLRCSGQTLLGMGLMLGLLGMSACGGPTTLTPGAYTYTLTGNATGQNNTVVSASTTVVVTVPPGIVVQPGGPIPSLSGG